MGATEAIAGAGGYPTPPPNSLMGGEQPVPALVVPPQLSREAERRTERLPQPAEGTPPPSHKVKQRAVLTRRREQCRGWAARRSYSPHPLLLPLGGGR